LLPPHIDCNRLVYAMDNEGTRWEQAARIGWGASSSEFLFKEIRMLSQLEVMGKSRERLKKLIEKQIILVKPGLH